MLISDEKSMKQATCLISVADGSIETSNRAIFNKIVNKFTDKTIKILIHSFDLSWKWKLIVNIVAQALVHFRNILEIGIFGFLGFSLKLIF